MSLPLQGIRVLDLSRGLAGPFCTQILSDYGAEVIKIEGRAGDTTRQAEPRIAGQSTRFCEVNRNKKSISLDLRNPEGQEIFKKLASISDIIVDVFRPGTMEQLGLGYEVLRDINERIIYCAFNAFGSSGPLRDSPAHDVNIASLAGLTYLTGSEDGPPVLSSIPMAALSGSLYAVIAILIALQNRHQSGIGQYCDISMLDSSISMLVWSLADWSGLGKLPRRGHETLNGGYAYFNIYETSDGKYVSLGASEPKFWNRFCNLINRPEFIKIHKDPEMQDMMLAEIRSIMKQKPQTDWIALLENLCFAPVQDLKEVSEHPQVIERKMIERIENFQGSVKGCWFPV